VLLVVGQLLAKDAGVDIPEALTGLLFYAGWTAWTIHRVRREPYCIDLRALVSRHVDAREWRFLLLLVPLIVVSAMALYLAMLGISVFAPELVAGWIATPDDPVNPRDLPVQVVEFAFGAVAEELVFRGVLLHLWAERLGVRSAVIATSVLFGAGHADVIGAFVFGVVMAALYVRTGTLTLPIVAHFAGNTLIQVTGLVWKDSDQPMTLAEFRDDWWIAMIAFAGALAAIVIVVRAAVPSPWRLPVVVQAGDGGASS
jgi:membrane protease YdiL (CAAX protease family)